MSNQALVAVIVAIGLVASLAVLLGMRQLMPPSQRQPIQLLIGGWVFASVVVVAVVLLKQ